MSWLMLQLQNLTGSVLSLVQPPTTVVRTVSHSVTVYDSMTQINKNLLQFQYWFLLNLSNFLINKTNYLCFVPVLFSHFKKHSNCANESYKSDEF